MQSFQYHNPTRLIFGADMVNQLGTYLPLLGQRILLIYGKSSVKTSGLYDRVVQMLQSAGVHWHELTGVDPNPRLSSVHEGVALCKNHQLEGVLAIGGGSVIDCAKAVAVGALHDGDVWEIITGKAAAKGALRIGTVLTLAATGSEMNSGSVITNWDTQEKVGWGTPFSYPIFSILDPRLTTTVPREHTVNGMVDIMSHVLEQYMHHHPDAPLLDRFCESILRTVIETAPTVLERPDDANARGIIMHAGTMALNGLLSMGIRGDWATHQLEHAVSAIYDISHGGGLAVLFPQWMRYALQQGVGTTRLAQLAVRVFDVQQDGRSELAVAEAGIEALERCWASWGAPSRLRDYGIDDSQFEAMVERSLMRGPFGRFIRLDRENVLDIYRMAL